MPRGRPRTNPEAPITPRTTPVRRGRKPAAETAAGVTDPEAVTGDAPIRRRRRRRTTAPDYAAETARLIEAVLKSRGARGASTELLQSVITWAREVREEGDAIRELAARPRRLKAQAPAERMSKYEMNRALLEGIISGAIALDIQENGSIVYIHGGTTIPVPEAVIIIDETEATPIGEA